MGGLKPTVSDLPIVLLPLGADEDALDACLAALEANTPAGSPVWLADDAQAGPRGIALVERWLQRTGLRAEYTRRNQPIGEVAHLQQMLQACGDADVVLLAPDARPLPGWLSQLAACLARDAAIATATPWCNAGEAAAWPNVGEISPLPAEPALTAQACAAMPPLHPELPAAVDHALALRGSARRRAGGLDAASFGSRYAALIDLSLRLSGLGWRNALCETGFVARGGEGFAQRGPLQDRGGPAATCAQHVAVAEAATRHHALEVGQLRTAGLQVGHVDVEGLEAGLGEGVSHLGV